ncbi:response regulator [Novosphingobium aquiterrae]|uniref:Response regulator n=1 Tax=Novosphingobium aquiterrae TaxID=624388 RepID=A0ABV6PIR9_9SPHN
MSALLPILVVEDEPLIRMELVAMLLEGGFTVEECSDGDDAIAQIDKASDLQGLITDIKLGNGPDGWAVAHHARRKFPNLPVVYVTGDSAGDWTAEGVPNSLILKKPYAEAQLMTAIASLLNEAMPQRSQESPTTD